MRILVTGATGFVGGRLAQRLLDDDIDVRALVRRPTDRARVPEGVEVAVATLEPTDALRAAVSGVDVGVEPTAVITAVPKSVGVGALRASAMLASPSRGRQPTSSRAAARPIMGGVTVRSKRFT